MSEESEVLLEPASVPGIDPLEAQELVLRLMGDPTGTPETTMTPTEISLALGERVSSRTVYRWSKNDSSPQSKSDLEALRALVVKRFGDRTLESASNHYFIKKAKAAAAKAARKATIDAKAEDRAMGTEQTPESAESAELAPESAELVPESAEPAPE